MTDREEVARAIYNSFPDDAGGADGWYIGRDGVRHYHWENALPQADVAIANIMGQLEEPSPAMIEEGEMRYFAFFHSDPPDGLVKEVWEVMIAEALKTEGGD